MERKYANHPGWQRILHSRFYHMNLNTSEFRGCITLFCMDAVRAPLTIEYFHRTTCIVDAGYSWMKQFPVGKHYTVTTAFDANGRIVQWYIDVCRRMGVGPDQIPWMDDLYLDVVVSPSMEIYLKDAAELEAARQSGEITIREYDLAWRVANQLLDRITQNRFDLLTLSPFHRQLLLQKAV